MACCKQDTEGRFHCCQQSGNRHGSLVWDDRSRISEPTNVTVEAFMRSLKVSWQPPKDLPGEHVESYTVRLFQADQRKRAHWLANDELEALEETISCLDPGTAYRVQVIARFDRSANFTSSGVSDLVEISTKPELVHGFLEMAVKQWKFVVLGAGLASFLLLTFGTAIWCCCRGMQCCGRRKQMQVTDSSDSKTKKGKKAKAGTTLPSAKELRDRERFGVQEENRYSLDPVQGGSAWPPRPSGTSTTSSRAVLVQDGGVDDLPPFLQSGPLSPSFPRNAAPSRPPLPWPQKTSETEDEVFHADDDLYVNQEFFPPAEDENPVYGNCQF